MTTMNREMVIDRLKRVIDPELYRAKLSANHFGVVQQARWQEVEAIANRVADEFAKDLDISA